MPLRATTAGKVFTIPYALAGIGIILGFAAGVAERPARAPEGESEW